MSSNGTSGAPPPAAPSALSAAASSLPSAQLREARRFAVQFVYQCEATQQTFFQENALRIFCEQFAVPAEERPFVRELVRFTLEGLSELDALVQEASTNWKLSRIAKVDLAILRVCASELRARADVGVDVIIADAAEIGKQYGSQGSSGFVNGVLDAIARKVRRGAKAPGREGTP